MIDRFEDFLGRISCSCDYCGCFLKMHIHFYINFRSRFCALNIFLACNHVTRWPYWVQYNRIFPQIIQFPEERNALFLHGHQHGHRHVTCKPTIEGLYFHFSKLVFLTGTHWWTGTQDFSQNESRDSPKLFVTKSLLILSYYINTDEIPGELLRENMISPHVKISPLLRLCNKLHLSHQKTIKVKQFGISLVFI